MSSRNTLKTAVLLAALTALFVFIGRAFGGTGGAIVALVIALGMNGAAYWFGDRLTLAMAHAQGLTSLTADFITVTADLALAHAVATFQDGRVFAESGDATPDNVNKKVRPHFARMALTRAKARALRDALNIGMCSLEELAE